MKERIRELANQAQKEVWGNSPYNGSPEFEGYALDAEKFAELIIKEVCNIVLHYSNVDEGVAVVKRNFGIEE